MKVKENCEAYTSEFHYDLFLGGYLKPENILENQEDIERVKNAIAVINEFEESCISQIEDFQQ